MADCRGRIVEANAALAYMTGYTEQELLALGIADMEALATPEEIARHFEKMMAAGADRFQTRWKRKDGAHIDVEVSATYMRTRHSQCIYAFVQDVTERCSREAALRLAATVYSAVDEAVMVTSRDNRIIAVNPAFAAITGYAPEEVIGKNPHLLSSGAHPPAFYDELYATLAATGCWNGEIVNRRKNGELFNEWLSIKQVRDDKGRLTHHVAVFSDISERKATERRMHHMAHYDVLTDLPNRTLLTDRIQQALAQARREEAALALMFIDLDRFKPVNDTLGHAVGDLLLKEVAIRLQECVRESDTVSRLGGDEFVVLLPTLDVAADALLVAEKILQALAAPFALAGHYIRISSSIGIAVYPEHGDDEIQLLKNADTAMYYAKKSGRNNAKFYQPEMAAPVP
ncbi:putative bifunctional diguanylate cyclase/phosphodiesterase [Methylogaea oryzae]|uniref:putative bifunctional diguanylate cyclase/phosphodiesterase n=1 Tax=Methylogaea oryzae TaxID=1295382 RepID=UPI0006D1B830|nr:sensor domain-containing diguanylate cyclase [Methylogaea oryzae]